MKDEIWTTLDGRKIAVADMDESHVRNALRMVLRRRRKLIQAQEVLSRALDEVMSESDGQDERWALNRAQSRAFVEALINPPKPNEALKQAAARHDPRRNRT